MSGLVRTPPQRSSNKEGVVHDRLCRDVLPLLLFVVFWGGMGWLGYSAFKEGNPTRLTHGIDSYGNLCGAKNGIAGPDLTQQPYLYYLNLLQLLDPATSAYAKSICVSTCPATTDVCNVSGLPCHQGNQYRCPYYRFSEEGLYGKLPNVSTLSTAYFDALSSAVVKCSLNTSGYPADFVDAFVGHAVQPTCGEVLQLSSQFPGRGPCYPVLVATQAYLNRCVPQFTTAFQQQLVVTAAPNTTVGAISKAVSNNLQVIFSSGRQRLQVYVADIRKGWVIVLVAGLGGGLVLSLLWVLLMRLATGFMTWATVLAANVLFMGCTVLSYQKAGVLGTRGSVGTTISQALPLAVDPTALERRLWLYVAIVATALSLLLLCFILLMIRRVKVAVACIKVASQAVATMPSLLLFPLLPFLLMAALVVWWLLVAAFLYSDGTVTPHYATAPHLPSSYSLLGLYSGSLPPAGPVSPPPPSPAHAPPAPPGPASANASCATDPNCYYTMTWDKTQQYMMIYHMFGFLWTSQFIIGFGYMVIAGAATSFYWSRTDVQARPWFPVIQSLRITTMYHLGTIALGSFFVAVVAMLRSILEFLVAKSKQLRQDRTCCLKCLAGGMMCCMGALERLLQFVNKNAYIIAASNGTGYCASAHRAAQLLVANVLRLTAINVIEGSVIWLGKVAVMAGSGIAALLLSNLPYFNDPKRYPATYLSNPVLPVALACIVGHRVATLFLQVYVVVVDTAFLCYCKDCDINSGDAKHASPVLREALGQASDAQAALPHRGGTKIANINRPQ